MKAAQYLVELDKVERMTRAGVRHFRPFPTILPELALSPLEYVRFLGLCFDQSERSRNAR